MWLLVRLLRGGDPRQWLIGGVVAGIALESKDTVLFLGAGLAVGLVLCGRWDVARCLWAWAGLGIALLLWMPNLVWQATNGWPQAGLVALALVVISGGKAYYAIGSTPLFMAAGAIPLDQWLSRGHRRLRAASFAAAAAVSGTLLAFLALPILPVAAYAKTSLPAQVPDTANQIGWPQYLASVEDVVRALPPAERAHAVILTNDYSEASPLVLFGTGLPPVYSGHNAYWDWGPPPDDRTLVVHVGDCRPADWGRFFVGCRDVARIDNGLGIQNSEQGTAVSVCTGLRSPWSTMWPALRTIS